ncbi:DUF6241 domain-containing protein [Lentibacillus sp. CBA3610]|uniref:DUF6241 domain-containing protein n=1 Tax=Lentibacillus sp. CBA3610 TaxID=2518176 RepID=UPI0015950744|nr:DUF6241 domain-containing protein [Lentibacillus sp. CBA3610]QKY69411.1 hypothetical protein Len3610_07225 [Lentibacillus sp. CBA3610]
MEIYWLKRILYEGRIEVKKVTSYTIFTLILLFLNGCNLNNDEVNNGRADNSQNNNDSVRVEENNKEGKEATEPELNPFGNQKDKSQIMESNILQYIHWMSHQKVKADDKWGFFEITDERIEWLLDAIDETEYLEKAEEYKDILNRWKDGNFSDVVNDHNYVWEILGGEKESQKATEILSESKEKEYIENTEQIDETYKDAEASN